MLGRKLSCRFHNWFLGLEWINFTLTMVYIGTMWTGLDRGLEQLQLGFNWEEDPSFSGSSKRIQDDNDSNLFAYFCCSMEGKRGVSLPSVLKEGREWWIAWLPCYHNKQVIFKPEGTFIFLISWANFIHVEVKPWVKDPLIIKICI